MPPAGSRHPTVIIGLGNVLMTDEGIGIHLVRSLAKRASAFPLTEFLDLGTSGMTVLHALAGRRHAIILDCARMNQTPGTIRRFMPDQVASLKDVPHFSLHEGDLLDLLALARRVGDYPETVIIYGIQPALMDMGESLSPALTTRLDLYMQTIEHEWRLLTRAASG